MNMNNPIGNATPMIVKGSRGARIRLGILDTVNGVVVILLNPIIIPKFEKIVFTLFSKSKVDNDTLVMWTFKMKFRIARLLTSGCFCMTVTISASSSIVLVVVTRVLPTSILV
jgi:hypothetical protein